MDTTLYRVAEDADVPYALGESSEILHSSLHLFWVGQPLEEESPARRLLEGLNARQLITEPFERAASGLDEAFRE